MSSGIILQTLLSGLMIGFVYALVSIGLNLIYGIMEVINFAHGSFLMMAMYIAFWVNVYLGLDPVLSAPITGLAIALLGALTYKLVIKKVMNAPSVAQVFSTFGLMVFLEALAQFLWTADFRTVQKTAFSGVVTAFGLRVGAAKLAVAGAAIITTAVLFWFYNRTKTGRALQATAISHKAAKLMGIDTDRMFLISWALGGATVGMAGAFLASIYNIFPTVGTIFVLIAFAVVVLGGFGSITGALYAGLIIGVVEAFAGLWQPAFKYAIVYALFIAVIVFRPKGLLGR
ncbi:MAG: branched-chain amino acid ABC transporter permease [Bacillota bacterium]